MAAPVTLVVTPVGLETPELALAQGFISLAAFIDLKSGGKETLFSLADKLDVPTAFMLRVNERLQAMPIEVARRVAAALGVQVAELAQAVGTFSTATGRAGVAPLAAPTVLQPGQTQKHLQDSVRLHPTQVPTFNAPVPDRFLWITTPSRFFVVNERNLVVNLVATAGRGVRFLSTTQAPVSPGVEKVYLTRVGIGGEGPPPVVPIAEFNPVTLAETDHFDPGFPTQGFIRSLADKLWVGLFTNPGFVGFIQRITQAGVIETIVDLSTVPAAPVNSRFACKFVVDGTTLHVMTIDDITNEPLYVDVDTTGPGATVRISTGASMLTSGSVLGGLSGGVAQCAGSLWIGDAYNTFPAPMPLVGGALFATDVTTFVTTSVPLDVLLGFWTGTMATDGTKLFAGFRDAGFNYRVGRIATDGTVEAVWFDVTARDMAAAFYDNGFLWVVVGFPGPFFTTDYKLVQLNATTMAEVSRTFLYNAFVFFAFNSPAADITLTTHGPP